MGPFNRHTHYNHVGMFCKPIIYRLTFAGHGGILGEEMFRQEGVRLTSPGAGGTVLNGEENERNTVRLSVVVPAFNERENIIPLVEKIEAVLESLSHEIIFIDDGSDDGTPEEFKKSGCDRLTVLRNDGRMGQSYSIFRGIRSARGEVIAILDADLQNDPADLFPLLQRIEEGNDVALGVRRRREDNLYRRALSRFANLLSNLILGERYHDRGCAIKCFRSEIVRDLRYFRGFHVYISSVLHNKRVCEVEVSHFPRVHGKSKYRRLYGIIEGAGALWKIRRTRGGEE